MYKRFFAGILLLVSLGAQAESSVWRVSKGTDQLWIGGTVHLLPPAQYPLPAEFDAAYQQSSVLVLETDLGQMQDAANARLMQQQLMYPAGTVLSSKLSGKTRELLQVLLQKHRLTLSQVEQFKPGMLVTQLTLLELLFSYQSKIGKDEKVLLMLGKMNIPEHQQYWLHFQTSSSRQFFPTCSPTRPSMRYSAREFVSSFPKTESFATKPHSNLQNEFLH